MVTRNDHQRAQDDVGVARGLDGLDDGLTGGLLRLALDRADEDVLIAKVLHLSAHLAVADLGDVCGAVAHEDERGASFLGSLERVKAACLDRGGGDGLGDNFLVGVDDGRVAADLAEQGLCDGDRFEPVAILVDGSTHFVILRAVHQVRRLHDEVLDAVGHSAVERLGHVVDLLAVAGLNVVDDDLSREGAADGPVGIGLLQGVLDALDIVDAAVVVGRAEGNDQKLVLADVILVAGIVLGRIARVKAEILGARFLTLDHGLLLVGQRVPGSLGSLALRVGLIGALLNIDRVNERGDIVGRDLVGVLRVLRIVGSVVLLAAAGGQHAQQHYGCEQDCKCFFHVSLYLLLQKSF